MASTTERWLQLCRTNGSVFTYVRDTGSVPCPCRTQQGFRDDVWHKTDHPDTTHTTATPGNLSGDFIYSVRFVYDQGEKWEDWISYNTTGGSITLNWTAPMENPPGGRGPAIAVRVYRKRSITDDYLLLTEIDDLETTSYIDNDNTDGHFTVGDPVTALCNDAGFIPVVVSISAKGFIQPVQAGAVRRLTTEQIMQMFGEIKADDHIGFIPCTWNGHTLDFKTWSETGKDRLIYNDDAYTVVSYNLIAAPDTGDPFHHWEVGLRLLETA